MGRPRLPQGRSSGGLLRALQFQHFAFDGVGDADAAALGHVLGHRFGQEAFPHVLALAAAERGRGGDARHHRLQHRGEERGLEVLRRLVDLAALGEVGGAGGGGALGGRVDGRGDQRERTHHITWMSACSAPDALIACRMEIMSRGVTPRALRPVTTLCNEAPPPTNSSFLPFSSSTLTVLCGTTVVVPWLNGSGWLTFGVSVTVMVRLPWAIATVEMRTSEP